MVFDMDLPDQKATALYQKIWSLVFSVKGILNSFKIRYTYIRICIKIIWYYIINQSI